MRKTRILLTVAALMVLILTCAASAEEEKTVITWWSGDGAVIEYNQKKVAEFNENNPYNIEINFVYNSENTETMLAMAIQSGQAPDILTASSASSSYDLKTYIDNGYIMPLNSLITDEFAEATDCYNLMYQGINAWGEDIYWVPTAIRGSVRLIYNKELVEKANVAMPTTLDELVEVADIITKQGEGVYYGTAVCGASSPWERMCRPIAEKSGILPYDYVNGKFDFSGYTPIIEAFRQIVANNSFFPGTDTLKVDPLRANFAEGLIGFYGNAAQEVGVLTSQFVPKMEWGIADLPTVDGEVKGAVGYVVNHGYQIVRTSQNPEAAFKVIQWLSSEDYLRDFYLNALGQPITEYWINEMADEDLGAIAEYSLQPFDSIYPKIPAVTPEGDFYETALWNLIWSDEEIDPALEELTESYNYAYEREIKMGKVQRLTVPDFDIMNPGAGTLVFSDQ